ncbi:hypothetical protein Q2100_22890, partial [Mycolicibacterium sp. KC 300]|nr:hypothetical protein [Mycolicibacterium arseniciresistens]
MSYPALGFPPPEGDGRPPDYVERTTVDYPDESPPPGGPPPGRRRLWWVLAAVAAVVVLGAGVLIAVDARRS